MHAHRAGERVQLANRETAHAAYVAAGRSYAAPIQWARDFLNGRASKGNLPSSYTRGATRAMDLGPLLPEQVARALLKGLPIMDRRLDRRFLRDATLTGPESRGSSPVRIQRRAVPGATSSAVATSSVVASGCPSSACGSRYQQAAARVA